MVQAGARWRSTAQPGEDEVTDGVRVIASKQPRNAATPDNQAARMLREQTPRNLPVTQLTSRHHDSTRHQDTTRHQNTIQRQDTGSYWVPSIPSSDSHQVQQEQRSRPV